MISSEEIKANYSTEVGLIILICRLRFETATLEEVNSYITDNDIDWSFFYNLVRDHDIRPLIYGTVSDNGIKIDNTIIQKLRNNVLSLTTDNIERFRELLRLQELFSNNNLIAIPVKGVILSYVLYGDIISRETCDIDYFIEPSDFASLRDVLLNAGYKSESYFEEKHLDLIISETREHKMYRETNHGVIKIELQWQAALNNVDIPIKNKDLLNDLEIINVANHDVRVLNMQNRLFVLMVHHGVNDIWRSLKHILDIGMLCDKYDSVVDWQQFHLQVSKYKISRTSQVGLLLSHQLFGTRLPIPIDEKVHRISGIVLKNLLKYPLIKRKRSFLSNVGQQLTMRDSAIDRLSVLKAYVIFLFRRLIYRL